MFNDVLQKCTILFPIIANSRFLIKQMLVSGSVRVQFAKCCGFNCVAGGARPFRFYGIRNHEARGVVAARSWRKKFKK